MNSEPVKPQMTKTSEAWAFLQRHFQVFREKLSIWLQPEHLEQLRPQMQFQAGVLAGFALLAAILLGVADLATRSVIELRLQEDLQANLAQVVPADLHDNNLLQDSVLLDARSNNLGSEQIEVYLAKKQGAVNAVCFKFTAPDGYAGPISLVMGVDRNGDITGVRVIAHVETPGLGDKIEVTKSKWVLAFNGKSLNNLTIEQWAVKKDGGVFDQFSGATITPRKVVQAIKRGLEFYKMHQAELLGAAGDSSP